MSAHHSDEEIIRTTHNMARFSVENRQITWVLAILVMVIGIYSYRAMPKRKDPVIPVRTALIVCPWTGQAAEKIEQLVALPIENQVALNKDVSKIATTATTGVCVVQIDLKASVGDTGPVFDDIDLKLKQILLPEGAGPIMFNKDFGDTATLMLTVASPKVDAVEIGLRARALHEAITAVRAQAPAGRRQGRVSLVVELPLASHINEVRREALLWLEYAQATGVLRDVRLIDGPCFFGLDGVSSADDAALRAFHDRFVHGRLRASEIHPDVWGPAIIRNPVDTEEQLAAVAGDKYSYRQMDDFTDLIQRSMLQPLDNHGEPIVARCTRAGVLDQQVYLEYSQARLAAYGVTPSMLPKLIAARNTSISGGTTEIEGRNLRISPTGEFRSAKEIGDVAFSLGPGLTPVYLRDLVDVKPGYVGPPTYLNYYTWRDRDGNWQRTRAITLAVVMRDGAQIADFATAVDGVLAKTRQALPTDLIMERTSDQPIQVEENVALLMSSLYEAIVLVIIVSLIGFWDWRMAALITISIPTTLAMTFAEMKLLGIDVQQVSIASLIIALGLLVDVPVVAGDAIKHALLRGNTRVNAAWLGPTLLGGAMFFATLTNVVTYPSLMLLYGDTGRFIHSLPIVLACSLLSALLVSKTFIPLFAYYFLKSGKPEPPIEELRKRGLYRLYYGLASWAVDHRWLTLGISVLFLGVGFFAGKHVKSDFFPKDLSYLFYVDVWTPEDSALSNTDGATLRAAEIIKRTAAEFQKEHPHDAKSPPLLKSITTFVGGASPRWWYSLLPEQSQLNYGNIIVQFTNNHATHAFVEPLQAALDRDLPGARCDVRLVETGKPVGVPVAYRLSGPDIPTLREYSRQLQAIMTATPLASHIHDDWGADRLVLHVDIDADRANLSGITNEDVAAAAAATTSGVPVGALRQGRFQIPIMARLRVDERAQLTDQRNLYVYSSVGGQKVPLSAVARFETSLEPAKIKRRNRSRSIRIQGFAAAGHLPMEVMDAIGPKVDAWQKTLAPGYTLEVDGLKEQQGYSFRDLTVALILSLLLIYLALLAQFKQAFKPIIVFTALPYGFVGAAIGLALMGAPFGFMAFLGCVSLIGVIVSHVIVLFDFVEEQHEKGMPLRDSVVDAGIMRLRPVLITVMATVLGLIPLAMHGGPLWEPLCYVQIGGLLLSTFVTLILVPTLYIIFVRDLKLVQWEEAHAEHEAPQPPAPPPPSAPSAPPAPPAPSAAHTPKGSAPSASASPPPAPPTAEVTASEPAGERAAGSPQAEARGNKGANRRQAEPRRRRSRPPARLPDRE
jgi:multidrug efflux pump subunit AcrB